MKRKMFTSESVTEGHPDKICDQISDAILDALLLQDPLSRVACETSATRGLIHVMGEINTKAQIDTEKVVRQTVKEIGYINDDYGLNSDTCDVLVTLNGQSSDIALGVDHAFEEKKGLSDWKMSLVLVIKE